MCIRRKATDYDFEEYLISDQLRSVCRARCKLSNTTVALKIYNKQQLSKHSAGSLLSKEQVYREVRNHGRVTGHPSVVSLYGAFEDQRAMILVLEYCGGGDIHDEMESLGVYSSQRAQAVARGLVSALAHLDQRGIIHGDVKPENMFLDSAGNVKLGDFGLSLDVFLDLPCQVSGSLPYIAPELASPLLATAQGERVGRRAWATRSTKADVWSCGVTTFEILTGVRLFRSKDKTKCAMKITMGANADKIQALPKLQADFVTWCLQVDVEARASSHELLQHPWMNGEGKLGQSLLRAMDFILTKGLRLRTAGDERPAPTRNSVDSTRPQRLKSSTMR